MVINMQNQNEAKAFARASREVVALVDEAMLAGLAVIRARRAVLKADDAACVAKWLLKANGGEENVREYAKVRAAYLECEARCIVEERCFARACKALRDAIKGDAVRLAAVRGLLEREAEVSPVHCQASWLIDLG
jgi:hypothetical protein